MLADAEERSVECGVQNAECTLVVLTKAKGPAAGRGE